MHSFGHSLRDVRRLPPAPQHSAATQRLINRGVQWVPLEPSGGKGDEINKRESTDEYRTTSRVGLEALARVSPTVTAQLHKATGVDQCLGKRGANNRDTHTRSVCDSTAAQGASGRPEQNAARPGPTAGAQHKRAHPRRNDIPVRSKVLKVQKGKPLPVHAMAHAMRRLEHDKYAPSSCRSTGARLAGWRKQATTYQLDEFR